MVSIHFISPSWKLCLVAQESPHNGGGSGQANQEKVGTAVPKAPPPDKTEDGAGVEGAAKGKKGAKKEHEKKETETADDDDSDEDCEWSDDSEEEGGAVNGANGVAKKTKYSNKYDKLDLAVS